MRGWGLGMRLGLHVLMMYMYFLKGKFWQTTYTYSISEAGRFPEDYQSVIETLN